MIKLALVGLGLMGKNYLKTLTSFKNAQITHLCSKSEKTLELFPKKFFKTTNYKSLTGKQIDGVIIAAPASTHFELASFFLKNNTPLLIEKPITTNYNQALSLARISHKTPLLAGHTLIYHPAFLKMKENLNKIGQIKIMTFIGANNRPGTDTSLIYDWGPHGISLFLDILGELPDKYQLIKSKTDKIRGFMELKYRLVFPGAIEASLEIGWNSREKKRRFLIEGTKGKLVFDDFAKYGLTLNNQPLRYDPTPPLTMEVRDFLHTIESGIKPYSDLKTGIEVIKVLDKLEKSAQPNL